mgnify:CR=1 FL=1
MSHHKFEDAAVRDHAMGLNTAGEPLDQFTPAQVAKLAQISGLLDELPVVTTDEELDAIIVSLIAIRDRP